VSKKTLGADAKRETKRPNIKERGGPKGRVAVLTGAARPKVGGGSNGVQGKRKRGEKKGK